MNLMEIAMYIHDQHLIISLGKGIVGDDLKIFWRLIDQYFKWHL